jgi:hypothetical protein
MLQSFTRWMGVALGSTGIVACGLAEGAVAVAADAAEVDRGATGDVREGPAPEPQPDRIRSAARSGVA